MSRKKEGATTEKYMEREKKSIYTTTVSGDGPVIKMGAYGPWFIDMESRVFLDFTSQVSLLNTGYCHPDVERFLQKQVETLYSCISADWPFYSEIADLGGGNIEISRASLAEKLIEITEGIMPVRKKVLFEVSGATALNAAMKIAKIASLRNRYGDCEAKKRIDYFLGLNIFIPSSHDPFRFSFLTFKNAFGGRHGDTQCVTNSKAIQLWGASSSCAFGRLTVPSKTHGPDCVIKEADFIIGRLSNYAPVVAFVFEPVQGEGGINVPDKNGMNFLTEYLREKGIYIIADEIQSGLGRAGKMFACEHFNIQPDMVVLSKSLGAGLPVGAVVADAEKFPDLEPGMHSGSHHCPPLACAAAIVNLDVIKRNLPNAEKMGDYAFARLDEIAKKFPGIIKEVRGLGLILGVDFYDVEKRKIVIESTKNRGLLLAPCGDSTIRVCPPIVIEKVDLDHGLRIFEEALEDI